MEWLKKIQELNEKEHRLVKMYLEECSRPSSERENVDDWLRRLEDYLEDMNDVVNEIVEVLEDVFGHDFYWNRYYDLLEKHCNVKDFNNHGTVDDIFWMMSISEWNKVEELLAFAYKWEVED